MSRYVVVLITASSAKEAEKISKNLISKKFAACVNIVPKIFSRYWWKGKMETALESLLIVKTKKNLLPRLIREVKSIHSYTVPEVLALPILDGNPDYLHWIQDSIGS